MLGTRIAPLGVMHAHKSGDPAEWIEKQYSSRHDEMCADVIRAWPAVAGRGLPWRIEVEHEADNTFIDVFALAGTEAFIIEVKTDTERACAGDVIRQLKLYRRIKLRMGVLGARVDYHLCAVHESRPSNAALQLYANAVVNPLVLVQADGEPCLVRCVDF